MLVTVSWRKLLDSLSKSCFFLIPYHGHTSLNIKNATSNKRHAPDFPGIDLRQNINYTHLSDSKGHSKCHGFRDMKKHEACSSFSIKMILSELLTQLIDLFTFLGGWQFWWMYVIQRANHSCGRLLSTQYHENPKIYACSCSVIYLRLSIFIYSYIQRWQRLLNRKALEGHLMSVWLQVTT